MLVVRLAEVLEGSFVVEYEGKFLLAGPAFDLGLALLRFSAIWIDLFVNKLYGKATPSASAAFLAIVLFYSTRDVRSAASVENAVSAP